MTADMSHRDVDSSASEARGNGTDPASGGPEPGVSGPTERETGSRPPEQPSPVLARTREDLALAMAALRGARRRVALVPTMGALHDGHRALIHHAHEVADAVVVTIFVNPLQFGPNEDFSRYPRPLEADLAICAKQAVAVVFAPALEVIYPREPLVTIDPGPMAKTLEGATRPGHFAGVLTVVTKLFNLVRPDVAVFGQKDAQQLALVRRLVADLDLPIRIEAVSTVREVGGLAISSRNRYLTAAERETAGALSRALVAGASQAAAGAVAVRDQARQVLEDASRADPPLRLDYLALVTPATFAEVAEDYRGEAVLAVAAYVGTTRLIDNQPLTVGRPAPPAGGPVENSVGGER
jgi:pantoate--beta-alanine ligase